MQSTPATRWTPHRFEVTPSIIPDFGTPCLARQLESLTPKASAAIRVSCNGPNDFHPEALSAASQTLPHGKSLGNALLMHSSSLLYSLLVSRGIASTVMFSAWLCKTGTQTNLGQESDNNRHDHSAEICT